MKWLPGAFHLPRPSLTYFWLIIKYIQGCIFPFIWAFLSARHPSMSCLAYHVHGSSGALEINVQKRCWQRIFICASRDCESTFWELWSLYLYTRDIKLCAPIEELSGLGKQHSWKSLPLFWKSVNTIVNYWIVLVTMHIPAWPLHNITLYICAWTYERMGLFWPTASRRYSFMARKVWWQWLYTLHQEVNRKGVGLWSASNLVMYFLQWSSTS